MLGPAGTDGKTIRNGTVSPNGTVTGSVGDFYIDTAIWTIYGPKTSLTSTTWPTSGTSLIGPQGAQGIPGTDGKTIRHGSGAPNGIVSGVVGDFYLDTETYILYGPKISATATTWPTSGTLLIGATGADGADGKTIQNRTGTPNGVVSGAVGDFYLNTSTYILYGPKTSSSSTTWPTSGTLLIGAVGADGKTIRNGTGAPNGTVTGSVGDFYIDTATWTIYGPKVSSTSTVWPISGTSLIGPQGNTGASGTDGKTIRNGTGAPNGTVTGSVGDFYLDTVTHILYGPKVSATATTWPTSGTSLVGATGAAGTNGNTVLNGTVNPNGNVTGAVGDFYLNTSTSILFGPKVSATATTWPTSGVTLVGTNGTNGTNGNTILNGTVAPTSQGVNGDFYINTTTSTLYGPKAAGSWPTGVSLIGPTGPTLDRSKTFTYTTNSSVASGQFNMTSAVLGPYTAYTIMVSYTDSRGNNVANYLMSLNGKEFSLTRDDETQQIVYSVVDAVDNTTFITFTCYPARKYTSTTAIPPVTTLVAAGYGTQSFTNATKWVFARFMFSRFYEFSFYDAVVVTSMSTSRWAPMVKPLASGSSSSKITTLTNSTEIWSMEYITLGLSGDRFTDTAVTVYRGNTDFYSWATSYTVKGIPVLLNTECTIQVRIWEEAPTGYSSGVPTYVSSTGTAIGSIGAGISNTRSTKLLNDNSTNVSFGRIALFKKDHRYTFRFLTTNGAINIIIDEGTIWITSLFNGS